MTSNNDDGHILYESGDFSFISSFSEYNKISEDLIIMLVKAYDLYNKYDMKKFFNKYEPPSEHKYMWWLPHQEGFEEWNKIRIIFRNEFFNNIEPINADFDLITRTLGYISRNGWQTLISDFRDILDYILENYWNYEVCYLT